MKLARVLPSVLLTLGLAWQLSCTPKTPTYTFSYAERRAKLESNGLRVVIIPDKSAQLVQVNMRYEVGSAEDPKGKAGMAHLVEHSMFLQRPDGPEMPTIWAYADQLTTFLNAGTSWDKTHYMMEGPKANLDAILKLEAMRLFYSCKEIREDDFVREREVVRNEIRTRSGASENQVYQLIYSAVYPEGHPYKRDIGGDDEQIASIEMKDVCQFLENYYVPERATLIVAGNVDFDEYMAIIKKYFGKIPRKKPAPRARVEPIVLKKKKVEHQLDIERTWVYTVWGMPGRGSKDYEAARMAWGILVGRVARYADEYDFATDFMAGVITDDAAPAFAVGVELKRDGDVGKALDFIWKAAKSAHRPFEDGVFDDAVVHWKAQFVRRIESLIARTTWVADLIQYEKKVDFESEEQYLISQFNEIGKLRGGHVRSVTKRVFSRNRAVTVVIHANQKAKGKVARASVEYNPAVSHERELPEVDPKEAQRPLTLTTEASAISKATRFELKNGMRVILLPFSAMPVVNARLIFDVGSAHEPPSKAGLADVAARFLRHPMSGSFDALGRSKDAYGQTGTRFRGSTGEDHTVFSTSNINLYLQQMIKGLERLITAGEYDQEGLERFQKMQRYRFKSKRYAQQTTYQEETYKAIYGPNHVYTTNGVPTPKSIGKLNRDDAVGFRRKHYSAKNATLVIAGSFDVEKAEKLIRSNFGSWGGGHQDKGVDPAQRQRTGPEFVGVIGKKDPQTRMTVAYPGPAGLDGQTGARLVLQQMLSLRMWDILREKLGVTYTPFAYRRNTVGPSMYVLSAAVDTERVGEALTRLRGVVDWLRKGDGEDFYVTFVRARRKVAARLLRESTVAREVAGRLSQIARFNLTPEHYDKLLKQVGAASPALVRSLVAQELRTEAEVVAMLGDREVMQKAFDENAITEVKYVEPELK